MILDIPGYLKVAGYSMDPGQRSGFELVVSYILQSSRTLSKSYAAYMLATIEWETARRWSPIIEYGDLAYFDKYNAGMPLGRELGNDQPGDGYRYRGRGYVQITGKRNYRLFATLLSKDIVNNPDLALNEQVAWAIASIGCSTGRFTGKTLPAYCNQYKSDYVNARHVINGLDHAEDIAKRAMLFESCLSD